MSYIIALSIVIFRISIPFLFGYTYYQSKTGRSKKVVLYSFIFYWLSNSAIVLFHFIERGLERAFSQHSASITPITTYLEEIQVGIIDSLPFPIFPFASKIVVLILLSLVLTVNFLHFIYTFIYSVIFVFVWVKYFRQKKEHEVVYADNNQEKNPLENEHENVVEENQEKDSPMNNENEHLGEDSPPVQKMYFYQY
jgi:magnesium-transporting ATPase (P-type)